MKTVIALLLGFTSLFGYCSNQSINPVTGKKQHISITPKQEIALGVQSVAEMSRKYGGIEQNTISDKLIDKIGEKIVNTPKVKSSPYKFEFHVLKDSKTINAFALPGGQVFITEALLRKLKTDGQIAGVLGHEIGHVVARHSAEQIAKQNLTSGVIGAISIGTYDPNKASSHYVGEVARIVGGLVNMKYGRNDESESDFLGIDFMSSAGYDPNSMIQVMKVLQEASKNGLNLEFFSTHPNPENRIAKIEKEIKKLFPNGLPQGLEK